MLPELEQKTRDNIVRENLRAAQVIHMAYMLDELRMYQVVDRAVDLFKQGVLPIARGPVVQALASYAFDSTRLSEPQRRNVYARVFGAPGGDTGVQGSNRDFDSLWLRFVASVADHARSARPETLLWPRSAANAGVRRAAQALAVNLSQHCSGAARAAAHALHQATEAQMSLLRDPKLLQAFGARDPWQVIESVNRRHLGHAADTARLRVLSRAGSTLIAWLATWADGQGGSLSDAAGPDEPSNDELVAAVNRWLEATGTSATDVLRDAKADTESVPLADPARETTPQAAPLSPSAIPRGFDASTQRALDDLTAAARAGGQRIGALFDGPAGAGKTVAAHLLASALARDLHHVHLSQVVSTTIGETERNLARVFDQAEAAGAVLLFDEADALFGKRSAVRDAHARPASEAAAWLLQRIDEYSGVAILEARDDVAIDDAFLRGLRTVARFAARR